MKHRFMIVGILLLFYPHLKAQEKYFNKAEDEKNLISTEIKRYEKLFHPKNLSSVASEWFDVNYYKLNLSITTNPQFLRGVVTINGTCRQNSQGVLVFDLMNSMHIDSVTVN